MLFKVLRETATGNLVLEPVRHAEEVKSRLALYYRGKKAAVVFDTIASVKAPLYLAEPLAPNLAGKELETKRV